MATANINLSDLKKRIAHAVEMAAEIKGESSRQYALASVLTDQLDVDSTAHGVASVLEDRLSETGQMLRLIDCLENLQKDICHAD